MNHSCRHLWKALAMLLVLVAPAETLAQQGARITASVNPRIVRVGSPATLTLSVEGRGSVESDYRKLTLPPEFSATFSGTTRSTHFGAGRRLVNAVELHYQLTATKEGSFTIPAQKLIIDGKEISSNAVAIQVRKADPRAQQLDPYIELELGKSSAYVGEVVPITVTIFFHKKTRPEGTSPLELEASGFVLKRFPQAERIATDRGGTHEAFQFKSTLTAIRSGDFELGPAKIKVDVGFPTNRRRGLFDAFNSFRKREFTLATEPANIKILPLPEEGKPATFAGAVGQFKMDAAAQPTALKVNDPIEIDVKISGVGNFDSVTMPQFPNPEGWQLYNSRQYLENRASGLEEGMVGFNQIVRPQREFQALPSIEFSYFDPEAKRYFTLKAPETKLDMSPDADPNQSAQVATGADFSTPNAVIPEENMTDILTIRETTSALQRTDQASGRGLIWTAQIFPAAALAGMLLIGVKRRAQERANAAIPDESDHRALESIASDLRRPGQTSAQFHGLVQEYFAAHEAEHGPLDLSEEKNAAARQLHATCQYHLYGASESATAAEVSADQQRQAIDVLTRLS